MATYLPLWGYVDIPPHAPSLYLTHEEALDGTSSRIDDTAASMVVAHHVRTHKSDNTIISSTSCNLGQNVPYSYHVCEARALANRRSYKHHTFRPVDLAQREWPHVYPKHVGTTPITPRCTCTKHTNACLCNARRD